MSSSPLLVAHPHNHTHAQSTQTPSLRNEYSYIPFLIHIIPLFIIMFTYSIKGYNSKGQLMTTEHGYSQNQLDDIMWSMSEEFGYAEAVDDWGRHSGEYGDRPRRLGERQYLMN